MHEIRIAWVAAFGLLAMVTASAQLVIAHEGATGVVKQRMELMKAIGENLKTLDLMMAGKAGYDAGKFKAAVTAIRERSGKSMTDLFPEGSLDEPTRAKDKIWSEWKLFETNAERLRYYAEALEWIAENHGAAISTPGRGSGLGKPPPERADGYPDPKVVKHLPPHMVFGYMKKMCSDCHETFRKPKKSAALDRR